ncbi:hypothetical protein [Bradyrhizobium sp.]|uniref:hypothetical protein n=1 Tax=Bradyrhizobium sp. TaxID=376 RepID=UPI0034596B8B
MYEFADEAALARAMQGDDLKPRGLYAKASVTYGQYARGVSLSFVEPYPLDYRDAHARDAGAGRGVRRLIFVCSASQRGQTLTLHRPI